MRWESESEPLMAKEPRVLEDVDVELEIGEGFDNTGSSTKLYHGTALAKAM